MSSVYLPSTDSSAQCGIVYSVEHRVGFNCVVSFFCERSQVGIVTLAEETEYLSILHSVVWSPMECFVLVAFIMQPCDTYTMIMKASHCSRTSSFGWEIFA